MTVTRAWHGRYLELRMTVVERSSAKRSHDLAVSDRLRELVELRIVLGQRAPDPLDDLVTSTPERVLGWMRRKARIVGETGPGLAVCDQASVAETLRARHCSYMLEVEN